MCTFETVSVVSPLRPSSSPDASTSTDQNNDNIPPPQDAAKLPDASILCHLVDVHCHPTDAPELLTFAAMEGLQMTVCAMSTHGDDQDRVRGLAEKYPDKVVPCFGHHPWWSHLISTTDDTEPDKETHYRRLFLPNTVSDSSQTNSKPTPPNHEAAFTSLLPHLPPPRPLSSILTELRTNLNLFPTAMLGEVGLDRIFRVPIQYHVAPGEKRELTPFTISLDHQLKVLKAQLLVAVELGRNFNVHSVKAQQATVDLLAEVRKEVGEEKWMRKKHNNVFLSLSTVINHNHGSMRDLIATCSQDRILAESDFYDISRCTAQTWDMVQIIAEVKGWRVESSWDYTTDGDGTDNTNAVKEGEESWGVVKKLERNWFRFRDGNHPIPEKKKNRRERQLRDHDVD
ncbi:hypothetical protein D9619_002588 [Psilocybe cf. subviscida]|uniref:TatD DNase family Scn1 n=1 Tax=Psilocybe cf. subviscida TaxID=2480587 RepID=A0A8H5AY79_9AGAR|nr:hypothetical protein D9619_002588 [Psilocybe cf. subviscida]